MPTTLRLALLCLLSSSALAHGTGEPHLHAHDSLWLEALVALLVLGASGAWAAQRSTAQGPVRVAALWVVRLCALVAALSAIAASLSASWGG